MSDQAQDPLARAVVLIVIGRTDGVNLRRAVGGANADFAELRLYGFQDLDAQLTTGGDRAVGEVRNIGDAFDLRYLGVQEIAQEEVE